MAMLIGSYEHRLESKGRLVLPARFREDLGDNLVASIGIEHCIAVYSLDRWSELFEKLKSLSYSKERSRAFCGFSWRWPTRYRWIPLAGF